MTSMLRKAAIAGGTALLGVAATVAAVIPTGVVSVAQRANVDGSQAALGANIYAGDLLSTDDGGMLRMRVGSGQLFLLASSDASMTQDHARIDMLIKRGTAGFSATANDPLEIDTPIGTVRPADDARAYGQISMLSPNAITITSYEGNLLLTRNGASRTIEAGKSYRVSLAAAAPAPAGAGAAGGQAPAGAGGNGNGGQWVFDAAVAGATAGVGVALWYVLSESPSQPAGSN
jgi:hypothetical protein